MTEVSAPSDGQRIKHLAIVGAGTMGSGVALAALYAGWRVRLYDLAADMLEEAQRYIGEYLARKGKSEQAAKLSLHQSLDELAAAPLWLEAIPEELELKQDLFRQMEAVAQPEAILATNTSTLSVAAIAAATERPRRVLGLHFFNPAAVMPLVELVTTELTDPAVAKRAKAAAEDLGKTVVRAIDSPGFIVNRVARPFYGEALQILGEGLAEIQQIDRLVEGIGFPMGPFRLMDFIGNDVNLASTQSVFEQTFYESRFRPSPIQQRLVRAGKLGRKSGQGFYTYPLESSTSGELEGDQAERPRLKGVSVYLSGTEMAPGLAEWLHRGGVEVVERPGAASMAILAAAAPEHILAELARLEEELPRQAPILCQTITAELPRLCAQATTPDRLIGADTLFMSAGELVCLAASEVTSKVAIQRVDQLFEKLAKPVEWVTAGPGMILPRIVAMLINEAAFAVQEGIASAQDIDRAMELGVRYPQGPLEWGQGLGYHRIYRVMQALQELHGDPRYRASLQLRRWGLQN